MDIEGLGEETTDLLYNKGLIRNIADLYALSADQLIPLERLGEKSSSNIIRSIEESKNVPYSRVLFALGIRHVGETVARKISMRFRSIDELINAEIEELTGVEEIGPKIASSIKSYLSDPENIEIINRLRNAGIHFKGEDKETASDLLKDKTIVVSGVFRLHTRDEYKELIEKYGGKNSSSVSSNTSFILAGDNMGPSKREKAAELGIEMKSEEEFLKIIGEI
jgi:DNA ligase (NAD+)